MSGDGGPPSAQDAHERLQRLGKYEIHKRLGAGGMGAVFLATDHDLKRTVALKVLPKDRAENPTLVRRFKSEAQAVAQLKHDNIVAIYEAGEIDGFPYIALEFVDGIDVLSLIEKRGVLPPKRSLKIVRQAADALQHAWERSIVHRDIKPANLLIKTDGTVKLTDLGLARSVDDTLDTSITRAGTTVGTVDYISPEQACDSKAADIRSDIYSLGCTWYHMLVGTPPNPDGDLRNKLQGHMTQPPPDPRASNDNVPEAYVAVLHRMMAKKPQDRYQTPAELLEDLDKVAKAGSLSDHLLRSLTEDDEIPGEVPPAARSKGIPAARSEAPANLPEPSRKHNYKPLPPARSAAKPAARGAAASAATEGDEPLSKKLPARSRNTKDQPHVKVDLDIARIAIVALIAAGALGGFWWAFSRWSGSDQPGQGIVVAPPARPAPDPASVAPADGGATSPEPAPGTPANSVIRLLATEAQRANRDGPPFPGLDDLDDPGSAVAREFAPDWVYLVREETPDAPRPAVVPSVAGPGMFSSVNDALAQGAGRQRVVELRGEGPFPLQPLVLTGVDRVTIRAAPGPRPLLVCTGRPQSPDGAHLALTNALLTIEGVDLLVPRGAAEAPRTLLGLEGGTIVLRDCTVTVPERAGPVTLCRVNGVSNQPARVLLERTLVRGPQVTAARCRGAQVDVVAGGSLLASQRGPLLDVTVIPEEAPPSAAPAADNASADATAAISTTPLESPPSYVRLLGTALVCGGEALRLSQPQGTSIARCTVQARRSLCAAAAGADPVLLSLAPWPLRATNLSGQPRVSGLTWRQELSQLAGWGKLIRVTVPTGAVVVADPGEWQSFWAAPPESGSIAGPAQLLPAEAPLTAGEQLRTLLAGRVPPEVSHGLTVGVGAPLPAPPDEAIERFLLIDSRPRLPAAFRDLAAGPTPLKYDLRADKDKLPQILAGPQTPDGAHVQLVGFGLRELPPLEIRGKSLRLEFVQEGGDAPLVIRPGAGKGRAPEASIFVEDGRLDLVNARFEASPSRSRDLPPRVLLARGSEVSLRNCWIAGSLRDDAPAEPLIEVAGPAGRRGHVYVTDCCLTGATTLLAADVDSLLLVLHNSVLASRRVAVSLKTARLDSDPSQKGWAILDRCTFLAGEAAVQLAGLAEARRTPAAHVYATQCVWAPAPGVAPQRACLVQAPVEMTGSNLFDWWDVRSGYAGTLACFRATDGETPAPQGFEKDWVAFWGTGHIEQPLRGASAVLFASVLTTLDGLKPADFALATGCSAARGASDGGPLGARVDRIGPVVAPASLNTPGTRPPAAPTAPMTPPPGRPDF